MADAYRDDLAYIHDAGFGRFAEHAAGALLTQLHRQGTSRGLVIDLACGSGILSAAVAAAGYQVLGIDLSPAMIALARKRVPKGEFRIGSFMTADFPPCVAVAAVGECFNYLFNRGRSKQARSRLFRRVHDALLPGGFFLFDVVGPGRVPGKEPHRGYAEGKDWAVLYTVEEYRVRRLLTRRITTFRKVGALYRRDQEVHWQRLLVRSDLTGPLRTAGFRAKELTGYGELRFAPGQFGFLAQRPVQI